MTSAGFHVGSGYAEHAHDHYTTILIQIFKIKDVSTEGRYGIPILLGKVQDTKRKHSHISLTVPLFP